MGRRSLIVLALVEGCMPGSYDPQLLHGGPDGNAGVADAAAAQPRSEALSMALDVRNDVSLALLGDGLTGANLSFEPQRVTGGLYLTSIRVTAGLAGLKVRAPRFEACLAGAATSDPGDAFGSVDVSVPANTSSILGPGSLSIIGWQDGDALAVSFAELRPLSGAPGTAHDLGGSCGSAAPPPADAGP